VKHYMQTDKLSLSAQYVHCLCSYLSAAVIISPPYISSHCSDCDNPNDDLTISMLHVILNMSYHSNGSGKFGRRDYSSDS